MIRNFFARAKYSWKTSIYDKLLYFIILLFTLLQLAIGVFKWPNSIFIASIVTELIVVLVIKWIYVKQKLSDRINQITILMRYKDYYFIHIYPSPIDKRISIDKSICMERQWSIMSEAREVMKELPDGKYATTSHERILKRLERASRKGLIRELHSKPVYEASNKRNVSRLYGCRSCKDKKSCETFNDSKVKIIFYYIKFIKPNGDSVDEVL